MENFLNRKVLLKYGVRANENEQSPNYPILAWDGKGTRLACMYWLEGKLKLFVYDVVNRIKIVKDQVIHQFDLLIGKITLSLTATGTLIVTGVAIKETTGNASKIPKADASNAVTP